MNHQHQHHITDCEECFRLFEKGIDRGIILSEKAINESGIYTKIVKLENLIREMKTKEKKKFNPKDYYDMIG